MSFQATIQIDQPIDEVFAYCADVSHMPLWVSGVSSARMLTDEMATGARFSCEYTSAWRTLQLEFEVIEFDPPAALAIASTRGPFSVEAHLDFVAGSEGTTTVTNTLEDGPESLATRLAFLLLGPILRRSLRSRVERELTRLRDAIATGAHR